MPNDSKPDFERLVWPKDGNKFQWIDRLDKIIEAATKLGIAYAGMNAIKHPMGAVVGLVAFKLATSPGTAANAVGAATLGGIGLLNYAPPADMTRPAPRVTDVSKDYPFESWLHFFMTQEEISEEAILRSNP